MNMLRILFFLQVALHGAIHLMGFAKAFRFGNIPQLTREIPKPAGVLWLMTALLFIVAGLLFLLKKENWWMMALPAVVLSQALISTNWQDAKFGTVANAVVLVVCVLSIGSWHFARLYRHDVTERKSNVSEPANDLLTEKDLQHLPLAVQNYLRYVGVLNKPKVYNYRICFRGEMRDKGKDWFPFTSEQYNFTEPPTRLFFMKGKMHGVYVPGYHAYKNGEASMQIKLFGMFPVVNEKSPLLGKAETVTIFNDMCLMAPATLIDPTITWEEISDTVVKATFCVKDNRISALLHFNAEAQLVNFVSDDRYAIADRMQYRFSTPVRDYRNFNGYNLPGYGEAIWHYPDGEFAYGRFHTTDVQYNVP